MVAPAGTTLQPCLAGLLRSCVHPPSLVLRVEHVSGTAHTGSRGNAVGGRTTEAQGSQEEDHIGAHQDDGGDSGNESPNGTKDLHHPRGVPSPSRPSSLRLALSDGHLQIQAVLATHSHNWRELLGLQPGDILEVGKFEVRSAPRLNGQGRVVYLRVQKCDLVQQGHNIEERDEDRLGLEGGGFLREADEEMSPKKPSLEEEQSLRAEYRSWSRKRGRKQTQGEAEQLTSPYKKKQSLQEHDSDDDEGFDTLSVSQSQVDQRRATLRKLQECPATDRKPESRLGFLKESSRAETPKSSLALTSPLPKPARDEARGGPAAVEDNSFESSKNAVANLAQANLSSSPRLQRAETQPPALLRPETAPLPLTTIAAHQNLASLFATRSPKSYACPPIFALISWISPSLIYRPNTPFPPKRHLKIHDPSISNRHSGPTVAVFVDAINFAPEVGTVALFRGLVMNWVRNGEDVILNRYPLKVGSQLEILPDSNRQSEQGEQWFVDDERKLIELGYDVQSIKKWWAERSVAKMEKGK